jgi:hypothetical protein
MGPLSVLPFGAMERSKLDQAFARVVGRRSLPEPGKLPSAEARAAMAKMARYRTRAPKGVIVYRSHEEANRDRERWTVDAMVATAESGRRG